MPIQTASRVGGVSKVICNLPHWTKFIPVTSSILVKLMGAEFLPYRLGNESEAITGSWSPHLCLHLNFSQSPQLLI